MRMIVLTVVAVVGACLVAAVFWAAAIPETRTGTASVEIAASPAAILAVLEAVEAQPGWRREIVSVERTEAGWTEKTSRGELVEFRWSETSATRVAMTFSSSAGYFGERSADLYPVPDGTTLEATERATVPNLLNRIVARLFFDPEALAVQYLAALKARVEGMP